MKVKAGQRYRHYQGGEYRVITVASHSITDKTYVVIQSEFDGRSEVCPKLVFNGTINVKGQKVKRFELIRRNI